MADLNALERVADLLPIGQKEKFFSLANRLKSVPDDDEYLLILEAIGYMTLIWKEIPQEIVSILEGANPIDSTCHSISGKIRDAVVEAIPSYSDLLQVTTQLEEHHTALKRSLSAKLEKKQVSYLPLLFSFASTLLALLLFYYLCPLLP